MVLSKTWNATRPEVPVDKDGNWLNYPDYRCTGWEDVIPFWASMKIDGMQTGRSSKIVVLVDILSDKSYPMFIADLVKGLQDGSMIVHNGVISGMWTGSKRGANYGIKLVKP